MAPPPKLAVTFPSTSTLQWHPAIAPSNGTLQWHPAMATRPLHPAMAPHPLPQSWSSSVWHTTLAPCNGTTTSTPPKLVITLPSPHHSTLQWHPAMALPQSWSSPSSSTTVHDNGTLRWHPAMAPRPLHPAMAPWCHVQSAKVVRRPPPYWK